MCARAPEKRKQHKGEGPEVGIYKRKQESKKNKTTRFRPRKRPRKKKKMKENTLSIKKAIKKKR